MAIEPIQEKLDDKIKQLNSSRVIKKKKKGDLSWYIASAFKVITSVEEVPKIYDVMLSFVGTVGWVGYLWHDRALLLHVVLCVILGTSILRFIAGAG